MVCGSRTRSGFLAIIALGALAGAAQAQVDGYHALRQGAPGQLATHAPYPEGRADDVRRPGFNGRLWIGRPIIGGVDTGYPYGWNDPGPGAYGASEDDGSVAYVKIGETAVALSPWEEVQGRGLKNLEEGRRKWLDERGYTGGVRTFVNDLYLYAPQETGGQAASAEGHAPSGEIQPRATIHMAPDQPRFKARMQVRAHPARNAAAVALLGDGSPLAISWPASGCADSSLIRVISPNSALAGGDTGNSTTATPVSPATTSATTVASATR